MNTFDILQYLCHSSQFYNHNFLSVSLRLDLLSNCTSDILFLRYKSHNDKDMVCIHLIMHNTLQCKDIDRFHLNYETKIFNMKCTLLNWYMSYILVNMKNNFMKLHCHKTCWDNHILMQWCLKLCWECYKLSKSQNQYKSNNDKNIFDIVKWSSKSTRLYIDIQLRDSTGIQNCRNSNMLKHLCMFYINKCIANITRYFRHHNTLPYNCIDHYWACLCYLKNCKSSSCLLVVHCMFGSCNDKMSKWLHFHNGKANKGRYFLLESDQYHMINSKWVKFMHRFYKLLHKISIYFGWY